MLIHNPFFQTSLWAKGGHTADAVDINSKWPRPSINISPLLLNSSSLVICQLGVSSSVSRLHNMSSDLESALKSIQMNDYAASTDTHASDQRVILLRQHSCNSHHPRAWLWWVIACACYHSHFGATIAILSPVLTFSREVTCFHCFCLLVWSLMTHKDKLHLGKDDTVISQVPHPWQ